MGMNVIQPCDYIYSLRSSLGMNCDAFIYGIGLISKNDELLKAQLKAHA